MLKSSRVRILAKASVAFAPLMALAWFNAAAAQTSNYSDDNKKEEVASVDASADVVVTGQRKAQQNAIAVKRAEFEVMDVMSADDIGKLPDHNTAAALRRIPGVSVMEDQNEPRWPSIRGLTSTYNRTTIDGAIVGSVDESARTVPMDIVPSVMAGRLEVIKTVTPENDANAIGGIINIKTRSAFDSAKPFLNVIGSYGSYEQHGDVRNDDPSYRAAIAAGRRFGKNDEWGIVVGASFEQLDYDISQVEAADPSVREYDANGSPVDSGSATGNGIQVPTQERMFWYNNTKQRSGVNAKLEWRPRDNFRWEASGIYSTMEDDEERIEYRIEPIGNVSDQTETSGSFSSGRIYVGLNRPITTRTITVGKTAFKWDPSANWTIDGDLIYSKAKLEQTNNSAQFRAQGSNLSFDYDSSDFYPVFTFDNPSYAADYSNYTFQNQRHDRLKTDEDSTQARFNFAYDDGGDARNFKAKFGGVYRTTERDYSNYRITYTAKSGFNYTLADVATDAPDELIQGIYQMPVRIDDAALDSFLADNIDNFKAVVSNTDSDYNVTEDVSALYAQASYKWDALTVLAGVRYEHTSIDSNALRNGDTSVSNSGSYDNWLPSLHLRWDVRDDIIVRAAYTNTIGRPDFGSLTATESVSYDGDIPSVSRGNPNLKPRESEGFDLSLEYYPKKDTMVSLAVFKKSIKNEIFTMTSHEMLDVGNGVEEVVVTQPMNANNAEIYGLEIGWQQSLTMLPAPFNNFGLSANATFLDTDFTFLTSAGERSTGFYQQPNVTTNFSLWYQKGPLEARISHNYLDRFLETINDTIPNADQYWKARHVVDASISWRFKNGVSVFLEGQNLTNSGRLEITGPNQAYLQESAEYGRTFWIGVSASF